MWFACHGTISLDPPAGPFPAAYFNPDFRRRRDACTRGNRRCGNRKAAFGSHSRRDSPASESRRRSLARPRILSPAHPRAARSDVRLTVPGFPATPFIIAADHGPAAPPVRSRGPLDSRLATRDTRGTGPSPVSFNPLCPKLFTRRFIYSPATLIRPRLRRPEWRSDGLLLNYIGSRICK